MSLSSLSARALLGIACLAAIGHERGAALAQDVVTLGRGAAGGELVSLAVPSFRDAVVVAPRAAGARPVVVVLHGMGDRPDWICAAFDALVAGRAWILCPRGAPFGDERDLWTFPLGRRGAAREVHAALGALAQAHGARVDATSPVLAGFSLGAMHASFLAAAEPASFPRAFIIDTHYVWSLEQVRRFAAARGRAVSFVCSRTYVRDCTRLSHAPGAVAAAAVPTRTLVLPTREHGYDRELIDLVRPDFAALTASDPRWVSVTPTITP